MALTILGLLAPGCAGRAPVPEAGEGARLVGQFTARVDVRSPTWHLDPGSQSRVARIEICPVDEEEEGLLRDCRTLGAGPDGRVDATVPRGRWEVRLVRFEMPDREGFDRPSPVLTAMLDGGLGATAFRYGRVEELVASYDLPRVVDATRAAVVDLGAWRLTVLGEDAPRICPEGATGFEPFPPDPAAAWAYPLLCQSPLPEAPSPAGVDGDVVIWRPAASP